MTNDKCQRIKSHRGCSGYDCTCPCHLESKD